MATREQVEAVERLVHESVQRVDAIAPDALRRVMPALTAARDELRADLSALWARDGGFDRFTAYQRAQTLRALEAAFDRIEQIQPAMFGALGIGRKETGTLATKNLEHEVQRLSSVFGSGTIALPQIDTAAVIAEGSRMLIRRHTTSAARYAGSIGDDVRHRLAVSLAKGDTFEQQVQRLRGSAEFRSVVSRHDTTAAAHGVSDAMFNRWRHWADRLVRTENMHAYNVQHDISIEHVNANRSEDDEEYLRRWDASADKVTCPLCKELDRTLATIEGTFKGGIKSPPRHPYCRCVVLAWLARWGHFKGEAPSKDAAGKDIAPTPDKPKPEPTPQPAAEQPAESTQRSRPRLPREPGPNSAIEDRAYHHVRVTETLALHNPELQPIAERARTKVAERIAITEEQVKELRALANEARKAANKLAKTPLPKPGLQHESKPAKVEPVTKKPPAPPIVDRSIPAGAQIGSLRRRGLVERVEGRFLLNARGLQFYAHKAQKEAARVDAHCQICGAEWALHNGRISIHGYQRPGYGFIVGSCRGSQQKPWEVDSSAVGRWIDELRTMLGSRRETLAGIPAREQFIVEEPVMHDPWGAGLTQKRDAKGRRMFQTVSIGAEDPRFDKARDDLAMQIRQEIERIEDEIKRQEVRLASWSPDASWIKAHGNAVK